MPKKKETETPEEELLVLHEKWVKVAQAHLKEIIVGALVIILVAVVWSLFHYQRSRQESKAAVLYTQALMSRDQNKREQLLSELLKRYAGSSAALTARLDLFDEAYQKGNFDQAFKEIEAVKKRAQGDLKYFVTMGEGYLFEERSEWAKAREAYEKTAQARVGLEYLAWLDLARVSELAGDLKKAVKYYQEFLGLNPQGEVLNFVQVKLAKLATKAEENKK